MPHSWSAGACPVPLGESLLPGHRYERKLEGRFSLYHFGFSSYLMHLSTAVGADTTFHHCSLHAWRKIASHDLTIKPNYRSLGNSFQCSRAKPLQKLFPQIHWDKQLVSKLPKVYLFILKNLFFFYVDDCLPTYMYVHHWLDWCWSRGRGRKQGTIISWKWNERLWNLFQEQPSALSLLSPLSSFHCGILLHSYKPTLILNLSAFQMLSICPGGIAN